MAMSAAEARYLIGPELLMGICLKMPTAMAWADDAPPQRCFISSLAIALLQAVIDKDSKDAAQQEEWHRALDRIKGIYSVEGGSIVEVTAEVVARWRFWRDREPLQFQAGDSLERVDQDVRLLLATADALALTYVEFDSPYLHQAKARGLAVEIIPRNG